MKDFFTVDLFKQIILFSFLFINIGFSISLLSKKLSSLFTVISSFIFIIFNMFIALTTILQFNNNFNVITPITFRYFIYVLIASVLLSWIASTFSSSYMGISFLSGIFLVFLLMFFIGLNSIQYHNFILLILSIILSLIVLSSQIFLIWFTFQDLKKVKNQVNVTLEG